MIDFEEIKKSRIERYRLIYSKLAKTKEKKDLTAIFVKLEFEGGPCPLCNHAWEKIQMDNRFCKGDFYQPDCYCFPVCPDCGKNLYTEYISNILEDNGQKCIYCGHVLMRGLEKRWGSEFEAKWPKIKREMINAASEKLNQPKEKDGWKNKKKGY